MSAIARKRSVLGFLLVLIVGIVVIVVILFLPSADSGRSASETGDGAGGVGPAESSTSFTIAGSAAQPISPGVMAPLDLSFTNPRDVPMSVTDLSVTVRKVSAPNADDAHPCAVGDFAVTQAATGLKVTVATGATSTLSGLDLPSAQWPQVGMLERSVNQDGCKGASLTLDYAASGTLAQ